MVRCPVSRSNETELVPLSAAGLPDQWVKEAAERDVLKKEGWPDFPFFWIKQPNMSSLQQIASRLKEDRKSTRLNSSHQIISYAVFCLKKKNTPSPEESLAALLVP